MGIKLFLTGDVMIGRGIDQILPFPLEDPILHEHYVQSALDYIKLAEADNGHITKPVGFEYIWGDSLAILNTLKPHVRIINLETSITTSNDWEDKGINFRMNPKNIACLTALKIDCCALGNNHILDWGGQGLRDTISHLKKAGIQTVGAGETLEIAKAPAILSVSPTLLGGSRVIIFSLGLKSSAVPSHWAASRTKPGVYFMENVDVEGPDFIRDIQDTLTNIKRKNDIVIVSIHWGPNWGYEVPLDQQALAKALIDIGVDVVYGHSSHHFKCIEIYNNKLILFGCGDFIDDYEGISGREKFRPDLSMMYFPIINPENGELISLEIYLLKIKKFRLEKAPLTDIEWAVGVLNRESKTLGITNEFIHDKQKIMLKRGS